MSIKFQDNRKIINFVLDPELDYMQRFEEHAPQGRTIGNIYSSCQRHIQGMLPRLMLCEPNPPLDCQVLEFEEGNAIASGDPVATKELMNRHIVHLAKWLGMGLPIEDKSFRPYNQHLMIYLYWKIAYVVIPSGLEIMISLGIGELWRLSINVQRDCSLNEFLVGFIPSFLSEARNRHHPIKDFEYSGYYRHDWFSCYLLPKKHDELDEDIIEALVGDHPS
jgi:hypothetical protein